MEMIKVAMVGIAVVFLAVELRSYKPVLSLLLGMAGAIFIMILSVDKVVALLNGISGIFAYLGSASSYFVILFKVLGVTYLCQFSTGICKDAGFSNLADQIQIFGKLYIMLSGMPILLAFIETLQSL